MLQLRFNIDGEERVVPLAGPEIRLGRSGENEIVLPDYSVSRRHAALRPGDDGAWYVYDLKSTNGVQINQTDVQRAPVRDGDRLKVGVFELRVESNEQRPPLDFDPSAPTAMQLDVSGMAGPQRGAQGKQAVKKDDKPTEPTPPPVPAAKAAAGQSAARSQESVLSNATIIRSLDEFSFDYGLDSATRKDAVARESKRKALDEAYSTKLFGYLTRLARVLITAESVDSVLEEVMEIAFAALPVDRGFILLSDEKTGELECEFVRINDRKDFRPRSEVPISKTMLESVMRERVALLTYDALSDQRLAGTESVRIHQIRAAMCAPLWSGVKIIGVMQVDTPHHAGSFTEPDIDLLTTIANYCAVAIERIQNAKKVDFERQIRSRLERYHSPGVIEEVMQEEPGQTGTYRRLKRAEATVFFADIVGFTAYSEKADPEIVAELMEGYFTHAVEAIFSAGGTLDKFIGDCVMAFFGAPVAQADHARRAVEAALRFGEALDDWNAERERQGLTPIFTRVGINSGPVVVGDIGSNRRVDYTVLGNTVNVAARIEETVAKPGEIVIGAETRRLLGEEFPTEALGEVSLKGLSKKITCYRIVRS